jgi:hypothetical protein
MSKLLSYPKFSAQKHAKTEQILRENAEKSVKNTQKSHHFLARVNRVIEDKSMKIVEKLFKCSKKLFKCSKKLAFCTNLAKPKSLL